PVGVGARPAGAPCPPARVVVSPTGTRGGTVETGGDAVSRRHDEPVLITEAQMSFEEEFAARKRRYSLIMACRIPCLLLAGVFGIAFNWPWVAVAFIVLSVPLPWVAVLIAN